MARVVCASFTVSALFVGAARADSSAPANVRHVRVVVAGGADDAAALQTSLHELLARIGADLALERVSRAEASAPTVDGAHRDFATVGVDLEAEGETRVVVADARGDVRMHRSVPRGSDRHVAIEQASHVVQGAVEALEEEAAEAERPPRAVGATDAGIAAPVPSTNGQSTPPVLAPIPAPTPTNATNTADGGAPKPADQTTTAVVPPLPAKAIDSANAGLQPDTTPPHEVAPPPKPLSMDQVAKAKPGGAAADGATSVGAENASHAFALDVVGGFALAGYGPGSGVVLGGAAGAVFHDGVGVLRPSAWLLGEYHGAFDPTNGAAAADVTAISLRALPATDLFRGRTWRLEAGAGGGIDVLHVSPKSAGASAPAIKSNGSRTDVDPIASVMIAAHASVAPMLDVFAAFRLDCDLATSRYESESKGGATETVFDPWRVRPSLLLGFTWDAVGPEEYPAHAEGTP